MMKIEKNKVVFGIVLGVIILFIGTYSMRMLKKEEDPTIETNRIPVPKLEDEQREYNSKLDAIDDLKEVRESNAPSIYDERLLDSTGVYNPDLLDQQKQRTVDSIFNQGKINYTQHSYRGHNPVKVLEQRKVVIDSARQPLTITKDLHEAHEDFFASRPKQVLSKGVNDTTDALMYVSVNGEQTVKAKERIELRLDTNALVNNKVLHKNALVHGFVSFQSNRVFIHITNINHEPVDLKAYDFLDGNEGIYIRNSFRAEARLEVIDDIVQDINVPGMPQVGGIKKVFQRSNRNVKVTIHNQYKLILKPKA